MKKIYSVFMVIFAVLIALNMGFHIYNTDQFNKKNYTINNNPDDECTFSFKPQNDSEISWSRTATINGDTTDLYACSFEGTFNNSSYIEVSEWTLRADINNDCFLNSAWCGLVEIHQNVNDKEIVQTLDLRNFDKSMVELTFYEDGDIFVFPLCKGDYFIYYPDARAKELNFAAINGEPAQVGIGIIFY